jgi:hypothetical protein
LRKIKASHHSMKALAPCQGYWKLGFAYRSDSPPWDKVIIIFNILYIYMISLTFVIITFSSVVFCIIIIKKM